jgi:acylphosphatase
MMSSLHLRIEGRVQGVCYRMCAADAAQALGITGWVRNRPDGTVEIEAEGEEPSLREFATWCRRGPPHAHVTRADETHGAATGRFPDFAIR